MKLYEITAEYQRFLEAVENGEIPEEAIADTLECVEAALEEKADNIACIIKNLTAEAAAIKTEEEKLTERRKAKERRVESLKTYLANALITSGFSSVETARNKITFLKSESVALEDEEKFIEWAEKHADEYLTYKQPSVNKTAIKKALAEGAELDGVHIETKQNIQIK